MRSWAGVRRSRSFTRLKWLAGTIGAGKTHLEIALGIEAVRQRRRVAYDRAGLPTSLVPFDRAGGELLFNAIASRYGPNTL